MRHAFDEQRKNDNQDDAKRSPLMVKANDCSVTKVNKGLATHDGKIILGKEGMKQQTNKLAELPLEVRLCPPSLRKQNF